MPEFCKKQQNINTLLASKMACQRPRKNVSFAEPQSTRIRIIVLSAELIWKPSAQSSVPVLARQR